MDNLIGLKENVLLGHLIPAGTGFRRHQDIRVKLLAEPPAGEDASESSMFTEASRRAEALGASRGELPQIQTNVSMNGGLVGGPSEN
jgi:hypothetical protein